MSLYGMKQMGPLALEEILTEEMAEQERQASEQRRNAQAHASYAHALGVRHDQMTPAQNAFVTEARAHTESGGSPPRGWGFRIPTEGRKPNRIEK